MKYSIKQAPDKSFATKGDFIQYLKKNKSVLYDAKKAEYKKSSPEVIGDVKFKMLEPKIESITSDIIEVKAVINTTNIIDSHMDLHASEIWNKTVSDNPTSYHLKQHQQQFESVLSRTAKSYNEKFKFLDLGIDSSMETTANINQFVLPKIKNPYMFDQYINGDVINHSVGMRYVSLSLAYYDEDDEKEMEFFEEKKQLAVNPEVADEYGFFWWVSEAKKKEGSAVVFGSNSITPTLWIKNYEPQRNTQQEPKQSTQNGEPSKDTPQIFINTI